MELTAAEPRRKGLTQLYIDGEAAVKIDTEVFLLSRLKPGDSLDDEQLHQLIQDSDARRAREKALYLLEHRSHSKKELTEKIARTAASREAAQAAADRMEEIGLIDDAAYARDYARMLVERKKFGIRRAKMELSRKGIAPELIEEVLSPYVEVWEDPQRLREILEKKYARWAEDEKIRRRAVAGLQRLGYSFEQIREAMSWENEDIYD